MIPIGDRLRTREFPFVNVALIVANVLVFLYEAFALDDTVRRVVTPSGFFFTSDLDQFFMDWGATPACVRDSLGMNPNVAPQAIQAFCPEGAAGLATPFTAMFIHGGWFHLIGNMLFLWVFGDNVEDRLGHLSYLLFYVAGGLAAAAAQIFMNPNDLVPAVGASGAIAAVLGAYLIMFPRANVLVLFPFLIFLPLYVPASLLIIVWFFMQVFSGVAAIGDVTGGSGGVAWWAHIGGFAFGVAVVWLIRPRRRPPPVYRPPGW
jgi:membrane associated rhomboid family serine protease